MNDNAQAIVAWGLFAIVALFLAIIVWPAFPQRNITIVPVKVAPAPPMPVKPNANIEVTSPSYLTPSSVLTPSPPAPPPAPRHTPQTEFQKQIHSILPPPVYDKFYDGDLTIRIVSTLEELRTACRVNEPTML